MSRSEPSSPTIASVLQGITPRSELYRLLELRSSRTNELLQGGDPGTTGTFARLVGRCAVQALPRARIQAPASRIKLALLALDMLEELHPEAFGPAA